MESWWNSFVLWFLLLSVAVGDTDFIGFVYDRNTRTQICPYAYFSDSSNRYDGEEYTLKGITYTNWFLGGYHSGDGITNSVSFTTNFAHAPTVVASPGTNFNILANVEVLTRTVTNFTYRLRGASGLLDTNLCIAWAAIGKTALTKATPIPTLPEYLLLEDFSKLLMEDATKFELEWK